MKAIHKVALISACAMLYSNGAAAQLTSQGVLDQVVTEFATKAAEWQAVMLNAATWLFWTLGTISLVWTSGMMILRKADIGEFFAEFVQFILFFGFFLWLLRNGPDFAFSIIQSLQQLGEQASGVYSVTPSGIVDIGFMIWKQAISNLSAWSPIDSFVGIALSAGIMILLAIIAINMLLLLVSAWMLMYAGIFFLGFGGSRWTSDMAINYYKTVLGVAVQLFTMILLIGIGNDLLLSFYNKMNKGTLNFEELGVMLVFCVALLMLINRVPPLIAGIITGSGIGNAGGVGSYGAGAAMGAAMTAASMATGGAAMTGKAMVGGATEAMGGASALQAAFQKAQTTMSACSDIPSLGSVINGYGSGGGDGPSTGNTPFAQAIGSDAIGSRSSGGNFAKAAKLATGTVSELAKGAGAVAKIKAGSIKDLAMERIADTTGGKIVAAIKTSGGSSDTATGSPQNATSTPTLGENSLASGDNSTADPEYEIAAFVNRDNNEDRS